MTDTHAPTTAADRPADPWRIGGLDPAVRLMEATRRERWRFTDVDPPNPAQAAMLLHGLADHTAIVDGLNRFRPGPEDTFAPDATAIGRWFHAVGDLIGDRALGLVEEAPDDDTGDSPLGGILAALDRTLTERDLAAIKAQFLNGFGKGRMVVMPGDEVTVTFVQHRDYPAPADLVQHWLGTSAGADFTELINDDDLQDVVAAVTALLAEGMGRVAEVREAERVRARQLAARYRATTSNDVQS